MEKKTVLYLITVVAIIAVVTFAGCIDEKEVEEPAPTLTPSPTLTPEPEPTVAPTPMLTETPTPAITITAPKPKEGDDEAPEEMTGTFVLHVTDQPSAIGDFDILNVSVSEVMLHRTGDTEAEAEAGNNGTTNETGEWIALEPLRHTFDLTKLQDGNMTTIVNESVETGKYTQVRLIVESANGIANENTVNVTVPGGMLKIVKPFTIIENQTVTFIFDINVVKAGQKYNLVPVIGKSGVI